MAKKIDIILLLNTEIFNVISGKCFFWPAMSLTLILLIAGCSNGPTCLDGGSTIFVKKDVFSKYQNVTREKLENERVAGYGGCGSTTYYIISQGEVSREKFEEFANSNKDLVKISFTFGQTIIFKEANCAVALEDYIKDKDSNKCQGA